MSVASLNRNLERRRSQLMPGEEYPVRPRLELAVDGSILSASCLCGKVIYKDSVVRCRVLHVCKWQAKCTQCRRWVQLPEATRYFGPT